VIDRLRRLSGARAWAALAVAFAVVGAATLAVALAGQQEAPRPADAAPSTTPAAGQPRTTAPAGPPAGTPGPTSSAPAEDVAAPVSLRIPSLGVSSDLLTLGLQDDGTVEVPPLAEDDRAGWYRNGPAPGEVGPAVLLGHVDSARWGPGVFFELGALQPGRQVEVTRSDGSVAVFAVDRVERYAKDDFPTIEVYGNTDDPQLRLITCGGEFDAAAGSYEDNVVAYARLVSTRPAA
jgi:sortase (surface protein transpeptidase)